MGVILYFVRYLVLSDIHANSIALEAVLRHADKQRWGDVIFLGDAVGYYTEPEAVLKTLRDLAPSINILGNHDAMLLEARTGKAIFSTQPEGVVSEVIAKHAELVSDENLAFVEEATENVSFTSWQAAHGALRSPWEYMATLQSAQDNRSYMTTDICLVGHTHVPVVYVSIELNGKVMWRTVNLKSERSTYRIPPNAKIFFNPGSVGQPRDGIPKASYAIFDDDLRVIEHFRVPFDLIGVQRQVHENDYPAALAARLAIGT